MLQIHGSRINESRLFVDGMSVMSGQSTGGTTFGNFLNNAMAQEIVVNTGAMSAEFELSGVTSNVITRQGSNTLPRIIHRALHEHVAAGREPVGRSHRARPPEQQQDREDLGREPFRWRAARQRSRLALLVGAAVGHVQVHRRTLRRPGPRRPCSMHPISSSRPSSPSGTRAATRGSRFRPRPGTRSTPTTTCNVRISAPV